MDKIYIVMDYVEHDLKGLMESMKEPFMIGERSEAGEGEGKGWGRWEQPQSEAGEGEWRTVGSGVGSGGNRSSNNLIWTYARLHIAYECEPNLNESTCTLCSVMCISYHAVVYAAFFIFIPLLCEVNMGPFP